MEIEFEVHQQIENKESEFLKDKVEFEKIKEKEFV
jgi:hypothetical protein